MKNDHPSTRRESDGLWSEPICDPDELERLACAVGGSWLLLQGLRRGSLLGIALTLMGLSLARRACQPRAIAPPAPARSTSSNARKAARRDPVQVASEDSFPASDPPAWTRTST